MNVTLGVAAARQANCHNTAREGVQHQPLSYTEIQTQSIPAAVGGITEYISHHYF